MLPAAAAVICNYGYRQETTGSSVGKSVPSFKVVSERKGQPTGFGMSIVGQIAHIVGGRDLLHRLLLPLWDAKRRAMADNITPTVWSAGLTRPPQRAGGPTDSFRQ